MLQRIKKCYRENPAQILKHGCITHQQILYMNTCIVKKLSLINKFIFLFYIFINLLVITHKNGINVHACIGVELHQS